MGKLKDSVTNSSTEDSQERQAVKVYTTGDNDSVEDAVMAVMSIRTVDGKLLDFVTQTTAVFAALERIFVTGDKNE